MKRMLTLASLLIASSLVVTGVGAYEDTTQAQRCTEQSQDSYSCIGTYGVRVVKWLDDDSDGDPYDENARAISNTCAVTAPVTGAVETVIEEGRQRGAAL